MDTPDPRDIEHPREPHYPQPYQGPPDPAHRYQGQPYYPYYAYYAPPPAAPAAPRRGGLRRRTVAVGAVLALAGATAATVAVVDSASGSLAGSGAATQLLPAIEGGGANGPAGGSSGGSTGGTGRGSAGGNGTTSAALATDSQTKGVVTIVSVLKYQNGESAGTGMILSSDGEILTNNHVVDGATSLTVTVASTGRSYRADVVGTDPSEDVAVIQLRQASGLTTANLGDSADVKAGDAIVGVGNAGGTGTLRASSGSVTALDQTITASDESGSNAETLHGLIGVNAPIISGDSGGPMYDSAGEVIGMNTAASQGQEAGPTGSGTSGSASSTAYAIPIDNALSIAKQIESGTATSTVHIGLPAFIGVSVADAQGGGAAISAVLEGGPAAGAGVTAGSVVTAVDGTAVTSGNSLKTALAEHRPGSTVILHWTGVDGASHSARVTLATGPAD